MGHTTPAYIQEYFRIRSGDTVGLNANTGWEAAENTNATIGMGVPFRIRFKVRETAGGSGNVQFKAQVAKNAGGYSDIDVHQGAATGPIIIIPSNQYADGDATSTELLTNTSGSYVNGTGEENNITGTVNLSSDETEFEFCFLIMRSYDGSDANVSSDTLTIRLVESDGTVFAGTYTSPVITIAETTNYIGGTYIEGPNRIGPFVDGNGNMYGFIENSESGALLRVVKSTDDGVSWTLVDEANSPTTNDIESLDVVQVGTVLHSAVHTGGEVFYNTFNTSDAASNADTWQITDETVIGSITRLEDAVALEVRSDSTVVCFYVRTNGANYHLYYKIRSSGGVWGSEQTLDAEASTDFHWVTCVKGASDKIHIAYSDSTNGNGYHRSLNSSDTLSARESFSSNLGTGTDDRQPILPPVYVDDGGTETIYILFKEATGNTIDYVTVVSDGTPSSAGGASDNAVLHNPSAMLSRQPVASAHQDGTDVHLFYADNTDSDLYRDVYSGGWGTDAEEKDAVTVHAIRGRVFTHSSKVFGYIYEDVFPALTSGFTGQVWYGEYALSSGSTISMSATTTAASSTDDTIVLAISRAMSAIATSNSNTDNTTILAILRALSATATATSSTPNDVALLTVLLLVATMTTNSNTPNTARLAILRQLIVVLTADSNTPDTTVLAVLRQLQTVATADSSTPDDISLSLFKAMQAIATANSSTPDNATLLTVLLLAATTTANSNTPDNAALLLLLQMATIAEADSSTPDNVLLNLLLDFLATATANSNTPDTTNLSLGNIIALAAILTAASSTLDTVALSRLAELVATTTAGSNTNDNVGLDLLLSLSAALTGVTSTPDSFLSVLKALQAVLTTDSSTPDTVTLLISGIVSLAATLTANSDTPDVSLAILRQLATSLTANSSTSANTILAVLKRVLATATADSNTPNNVTLLLSSLIELAATLTATSGTPNTSILAVLRQLTSVLEADSNTNDITVMSLAKQLQAIVTTNSNTPDNVTILIGGIVGLMCAVITARQPGINVTARQPGTTITARKPSLTITAKGDC